MDTPDDAAARSGGARRSGSVGAALPPPSLGSEAPADTATIAGLSPVPPSAVGRLVVTWRVLLGVAWMAAFFAYAAVWQASVQLGIGLWWVGPRAQPTSAWLRIIPFALCLTLVVLVAYGVRRLPTISTAVAIVLLGWAIPDFSRSTGLAVTEVAIAIAVLVVSLLARTGQIRLASPAAPGAAPVGLSPPT